VKDYAAERDISASNAGVRIFRARGAPKAGRAFVRNLRRARLPRLYVRRPACRGLTNRLE
jgi:hypothetical protein